jgi:hypothetical protein
MSKLRISGLVAAMNRVREQWQHGLTAAEAPAFHRMILEMIARVERLCREHGHTARQLPAPSYRAYLYLKSLDLDAMPVRADGSPVPAGPPRVRNLVAFCARIQSDLLRLAQAGDGPDDSHPVVIDLLARIQSQAAAVAAICLSGRTTPAALPTPSRRAYQWLAYLGVSSNLLRLLATLREAAHVIAGLDWLCDSGIVPERLRFELLPGEHLYRTRAEGRDVRIIAAPGFVGAPRDVLEALVRAALSRRQRKARALIKAYASGEAFAAESLTYELAAGLLQAAVRGRCYDLVQVFAQVNAEYFDGRLTSPRLAWSKTMTWQTLGHYRAESDTVMISLTLDNPAVPPNAIAFVMYHELLHRELGVPLVNGRRQVHSRTFHNAERRFKQCAEAEEALKRVAASWNGRPQ